MRAGTYFSVIIFFTVIVIPIKVSAQYIPGGYGTAVVFFDHKNTVIRIDTALVRRSSQPIVLKAGKHIVKAWAPHKELYCDTIIIKENGTTFVTKRLIDRSEYVQYKKENRNYHLKRAGTRVLPIFIIAGYSALTWRAYAKNDNRMKDHLTKALVAKDGYENSVSLVNIAKYEEEYYTEKGQYESYVRRNNRIVKTALVAIPVGAVLSAGLFVMSKRFQKPFYSEAPLLSINFSEGPMSFCSIGLHFPLK
jgi:hypothetical protein